jgi:hypothetical protein
MNDLIEREETAVQVSQPTTPANLLQIAVQRGASMEELEKLMGLQERHEANEAKKAFHRAKAEFSAESILITKDRENKQFKSRYTSIGNLVNTVRPFLGRYGLSTSWTQTQDEGGTLTITCRMTHSQGHFEESSFTVPPDKSGAKNVIQELKSAITYARITTFENVTGLTASDESGDDDGNCAGKPEAKPKEKHPLGAKGFEAACKAVVGGEYSAASIRATYALTVDQETVLADIERQG